MIPSPSKCVLLRRTIPSVDLGPIAVRANGRNTVHGKVAGLMSRFIGTLEVVAPSSSPVVFVSEPLEDWDVALRRFDQATFDMREPFQPLPLRREEFRERAARITFRSPEDIEREVQILAGIQAKFSGHSRTGDLNLRQAFTDVAHEASSTLYYLRALERGIDIRPVSQRTP